MLANDDFHKEVAAVEDFIAKEKEPAIRHLLKMTVIMAKFLHNIRSNQVTQMKADGVELVKPKGKDQEK